MLGEYRITRFVQPMSLANQTVVKYFVSSKTQRLVTSGDARVHHHVMFRVRNPQQVEGLDFVHSTGNMKDWETQTGQSLNIMIDPPLSKLGRMAFQWIVGIYI